MAGAMPDTPFGKGSIEQVSTARNNEIKMISQISRWLNTNGHCQLKIGPCQVALVVWICRHAEQRTVTAVKGSLYRCAVIAA